MTTTPTSEGPPVVELDGLSVQLGGRTVLDDLRGRLGARAIGLLGPNGAGKTTLIRTMLGFFQPSAGTARVLGQDVRDRRGAVRDLVGYMPEDEVYVPGMSAVRFVRLMAELSGLPPDAALERAHDALFWVGLGEARYRGVDTFSTGMKQMAKLAQAIVHGPRLLILDEPTNGLDPPARRRMLELVRAIRDRGETRVLLSSHLLPDVESVCDEVIILKEGRIAAHADLEAERRATRDLVELEVAERAEELAAAAAGLGCETAVLGPERVKVVLANGIKVGRIFALADELGAPIRRLGRRRDSLTDIFLRAMGGGA